MDRLEIKNGYIYSVEDKGKVVGIFISNGIVDYSPNGDDNGYIHYHIHACLFNTGSVMNPIILAGPMTTGNQGVKYPKDICVRYAKKTERTFLLKKLIAMKLYWDKDKKELKRLKVLYE